MPEVTTLARLLLAGIVGLQALHSQTDLFSYSVFRSYDSSAPPEATAFSGDGKRLAIASATAVLLIGIDDRSRRELPLPGARVEAMALSRDGLRIATGLFTQKVRLRDWDGAADVEIKTAGRITALAFAPDSSAVAYAAEKWVVIADAKSGREMLRLPCDGGSARFLGFRNGGASLVGVTSRGLILEWDVKRGTSIRRLQDDDNSAYAAALSGSGDLLALGTEFAALNKANPFREAHPSDFHRENRLKIYDLRRGTVVKQIDGVDGQLRALSISADGRFAAAYREKQRSAFLAVYDLQRGVEIAALPSLRESRAAEFSPDGAWLAGTSPEGRLTLFEVRGIQRGSSAGDLTGVKIQITSSDRAALIAPRSRMTIAVMDLEPLGLAADVAGAVFEMLRNRLSGSPNLEMIERARMRQIMSEQEFQNSDRADFRAAARLGRLLTVQKMIFGSVSQLGGTFTISVQVVDVETARVDGIREVLCQRCTVEDLPAALAELKTSLVAGN